MEEKRFRFGERLFTVRSEKTLSDAVITPVSESGGVKIYEIGLSVADRLAPSDAVIFWEEKPEGITGFWSPTVGRNRYIPQGWYPQKQYSTLTDGAPVIALFGDEGNSKRTYAASEAERPLEFSMWLRNDPGRDVLRVQLALFPHEAPGEERLSFRLRIDERDLPLPCCIRQVGDWWRDFYPADKRRYSEDFAGNSPLFSSWYACFQDPTQAVLEKELPVIADLGFRSLIIDDGWSYDGAGDGAYSFCGTWNAAASKFPDMAAFVRKAHEYGIRVALWFPLPFVGKKNPDHERFLGRYLAETMGADVLDPRFPEVRDYIVSNFVNVIAQYGLDGLKLDFLTDFNRPADPDAAGIDCVSVSEGVTKLLASIESEVRSPDPDMLIEYRVNYIGPSVTRHCNMLRMCDCAFDFITNRIGTVDLRMLAPAPAVHSDMLLWARDETPENIAVMLLNVMFAVPQISVLTAEMDERQKAVLKNDLSYRAAHRDLLLHGDISVTDPLANYSSVSASDGTLTVTVLYLPRVLRYEGGSTDVFNAGTEEGVSVHASVGGKAVCYDIYGEKISENRFVPGAVYLPVPRGGRAELRPVVR